jgi:hypothetical protein
VNQFMLFVSKIRDSRGAINQMLTGWSYQG